MLKSLEINNYAIIDEISISFSPQLNVITGETGAGKSILMGALSLILGDRADSNVLLRKEKKCVVEGVFVPDNRDDLKKIFEENDLDSSDEILIRREILGNGKSRAFINDTPVSLGQLKQISSLLVDLHRQFDTLSLSDLRFQLQVVDALAENRQLLGEYQNLYRSWKIAQEELVNLQLQKSSFEKEYDYNRFLFDELEDAALGENELEEAEEELKLLSHSESIKQALAQASSILSGGEQPMVQQIRSVQYQLGAFSTFHKGVEGLLKRMQSVQIELQDIADEMEKLNDEVSHDPSRIDQLNDRISTGYKLMKKHGVNSTAALLTLKNDLAKKLEAVMNIDQEIAQKEQKEKELKIQVDKHAEKLTEKRIRQVKPLQDKVNKLLAQVGMPNARLKVALETGEDAGPFGKDHIEFMFNANLPADKAGKDIGFEPVRKVASGGELSRLMLSIKSLVAESMDMPTLIFDEIDTGISGEAARQVGEIMKGLAENRQLITITHQPQIAGRAHTHLFVYKDVGKDVIKTNIRVLSGEERVVAIAKMLGGEKPTPAAMENAREMVMQ